MRGHTRGSAAGPRSAGGAWRTPTPSIPSSPRHSSSAPHITPTHARQGGRCSPRTRAPSSTASRVPASVCGERATTGFASTPGSSTPAAWARRYGRSPAAGICSSARGRTPVSRRSAASWPLWARTGLDRCGRLERDHLPAFFLLAPRSAEKLDSPGDHLESASPLPLVLPRAGLEPPVDGDAASLAELLGAHIALPVPGRHAHEVRASVPARAVHREHEARHLLVRPDLAQLDLGRE